MSVLKSQQELAIMVVDLKSQLAAWKEATGHDSPEQLTTVRSFAEYDRIPTLISEWLERAIMYDERSREASRRHEDIISAQQAGLATAFRVCANDLEWWRKAATAKSAEKRGLR